jgi:hypothetical protein
MSKYGKQFVSKPGDSKIAAAPKPKPSPGVNDAAASRRLHNAAMRSRPGQARRRCGARSSDHGH